MFRFPGGSRDCDCNSSTSKLEIFVALFAATADLIVTWMSNKEEKKMNNQNVLSLELNHFKEEVRYLREELKIEQSIRSQIEKALEDKGLDLEWTDVETTEE